MQSEVRETTCIGHPAIVANNGILEITIVPELGSNLIAIRDLETGISLLRTPATKEEYLGHPILFGIPVLFPPNRLEDGKLKFRDEEYHFDLNEPKYHNHIHGLVHDKPWTLVEYTTTPDGAVIITEIDSAHFPEILRQFPHRFVLRMTTQLEGHRVRTSMQVSNHSDSAMPWGLGYHTTLMFPFTETGDIRRCRFQLSAKRRWALTDRLLPTGELLDSADLSDFRSGIVLADKPLDDVFMSEVVDGGDNLCVLDDPDSGLTVKYVADPSFLHWVVYNADSWKGYVCPEPYTWVTNAPNLPMEPAVTGLRVLNPGESAESVTSLEVSHRK